MFNFWRGEFLLSAGSKTFGGETSTFGGGILTFGGELLHSAGNRGGGFDLWRGIPNPLPTVGGEERLGTPGKAR